MRVAASAGALLALARRWAGFLFVGMSVLGVSYFVSAIGWPALPPLWATTLPPAEAAAVLIAHAFIPIALAWALREALLPARWLLAERALPLTRRQRGTADLAVVALAQSPLFLLYAASLLSWRHADPTWLLGHWPRGLAFVAASVALSLAGGTALLALRRHQPRPRQASEEVRSAAALPPWRALLLLPLWRGPARPVLLALALTLAGLLLCLLGAGWLWPAEPRWCLAAYALVAMAGCPQAHARAQREFAPLLAAAAPLPLPPRYGPRAPRLLALSPALLAWPVLLLLMALGPWPLAPLAAPAYAAAALLAPAAPLWLRTPDAEPRAAFWMLSLVLWVALATEFLAR